MMAGYVENFSVLLDLAKEHYKIDPDHFEKYKVKRGLRNEDGTGVLAGLTSIGEVKGYIIDDGERVPVDGGLYYRGMDVRELVKTHVVEKMYGFEETAFLLLFGMLPDRDNLERFCNLIGELRTLPTGFTEDMILKAPSKDIMNKLARAVLASYSYDSNPDDIGIENIMRQSIELIARLPVMAAYAYHTKRHYYHNETLCLHPPKSDVSTARNFLYMMRLDGKFTELEAETLDLLMVLHAEHGGGNNSAFACRVVSSSGTDTYSAIASAIGSLKGPKHGGANAKVEAMMDDIKKSVKNWSDEDEIAKYLEKIINKEANDKTGLVYGMGHAVYTLSDPRAILLKEKAIELAKNKNCIEEYYLYEAVERLTPDVFDKVKGNGKVISANVDLYSGFVYKMLNIPPELYTPLFAISRIVGWCAHRIEEVMTGGRIIRPAYKSICGRNDYIPLDKR